MCKIIGSCGSISLKLHYICSRFRLLYMSYRFVSKILLLACLLLVSCGKHTDYRIAVDCVEPLEVTRFDKGLLQYVQLADTVQKQSFIEASGEFWYLYNRRLLGLDDAPYFDEGLARFMGDSIVSSLYADVQACYADMSAESESLAQLVARYKVLFPHKPTPVVLCHISGLGRSIVTLDSLISISLDCYMGEDYAAYKQRYHTYELPLHTRRRIVADVAEVLLRNAVPRPQGATLLDAMVYEGRIAYLMSGLIDDNRPEAVMGYSPLQAAWCRDYEAKIWAAIVEQSHLFATDNITIRKYIQPSPFTATLTQDSPGRVGRWVGWRIVEAYAKRQVLTPQQIVNDTLPATDVLRQSGYMGK